MKAVIIKWGYPILKYLLTEWYKRKFNRSIIIEDVLKNKEALRDKFLDYSKSRIIEYYKDNYQEGFEGTIDDTEELLWWEAVNIKTHISQDIPSISTEPIEYNQLENKTIFWNTQCFNYGNLGMFSDNLAYQHSSEDRTQLSYASQNTREYDKAVWGYFTEWFRINSEFMDDKGIEHIGYKWKVSDVSKTMMFLEKWYTIIFGLRLSEDIKKGLQDDWVLEASEVTGSVRYGHLPRFRKWEDGNIDLIDNYKGIVKNNIATVEEFENFIKSEYVMDTAICVVPKNTPEPSDYQKFLNRELIKVADPSKIIDQKYLFTVLERVLQSLGK